MLSLYMEINIKCVHLHIVYREMALFDPEESSANDEFLGSWVSG